MSVIYYLMTPPGMVMMTNLKKYIFFKLNELTCEIDSLFNFIFFLTRKHVETRCD